MQTKLKIGAVLIAALALCLPAALFFPHLLLPALFVLSGVAGTVTYATFLAGDAPHEGYAGGGAPPNFTEAQTVNAVGAHVTLGDTDTIDFITHNFQLSPAQLAAMQPYIQWTLDANAAPTVMPIIAFSSIDGNTVVVTKDSNTGNGCTVDVIIRRPWSASQ